MTIKQSFALGALLTVLVVILMTFIHDDPCRQTPATVLTPAADCSTR